jgi:hypothetical protein
MMLRVKKWIAAGKEVKIFTARAAAPEPTKSEVIGHIQDWLAQHGLPRLEVTNVKDFGMIELWDDRAIQVIPNTGRPVG